MCDVYYVTRSLITNKLSKYRGHCNYELVFSGTLGYATVARSFMHLVAHQLLILFM